MQPFRSFLQNEENTLGVRVEDTVVVFFLLSTSGLTIAVAALATTMSGFPSSASA
ncbi:hypothetical protein [Mesorhizobium retamae]|uniref:hypothetical protein n=1 Tax=Mesorhizobium retamae TaxID=2912854 RepID=UPI0023B778D3|nr:hypothetical protein [Mesorhizobium sp. IRAMC:0171]